MEFQCSSASRKFLNMSPTRPSSSRRCVSVLFSEPKIPQWMSLIFGASTVICFSALQRAENSSIHPKCQTQRRSLRVSVLFSEPKIPQSVVDGTGVGQARPVSVLFSEPKIPQCFPISCWGCAISCFSALQRAENSSIGHRTAPE